MKATPGLFLLIAEIWMRQQDLPDNNGCYETDCLNLSSDLSKFFRPDDMSTAHILIDAMAGDLSKFATAMAKAIHNAAYGGPHWMVTYPCLTSIRGTLSLHSARFSNMLISMNVMEDVCHILDVYGSPPESPEPQNQPSPSAPRDWLIVSLSSITQGSKGTDGFTWVVRAIKSKLIVLLLKCACWLSADLDRHTYLMSKFLGPYLVYRSVLRALGQAVQSPEIPTLIERVPRNGTFWEEWLEFSDKLRSLMESKLEFDQAGKYRQECASPGCDAVENDSEIFRFVIGKRDSIVNLVKKYAKDALMGR
ncbi:hypothetical protein Hypma_000796 [Hypsizygus marmoreus]|uniref:Uncharacterized protein n=1 Tax=Hypsizygus marmoreus TaxID=39966 RepID=A0A369J6W7_HYPMA|nr:hypothetical protein Hypma_000796 [Hypsizygus marmoreus]